MLLDLIQRYGIDPSQSFMVGDRDVDIQAGQAAGVTSIFIGEKEPLGIKPDYMFTCHYEAVTQMHESGILH